MHSGLNMGAIKAMFHLKSCRFFNDTKWVIMGWKGLLGIPFYLSPGQDDMLAYAMNICITVGLCHINMYYV